MSRTCQVTKWPETNTRSARRQIARSIPMSSIVYLESKFGGIPALLNLLASTSYTFAILGPQMCEQICKPSGRRVGSESASCIKSHSTRHWPLSFLPSFHHHLSSFSFDPLVLVSLLLQFPWDGNTCHEILRTVSSLPYSLSSSSPERR